MQEIKRFDIHDKWNWLVHYVRYRKNQFYEKVTGKSHWAMPKMVAGHILLSTKRTNKEIYDAIIAGKPYWAGRWGGTEMNMIYEFMKHGFHSEYDNREEATNRLCSLSGFFPNDIELGQRFVDSMLSVCGQIDLQGQWRRYMEDYIYLRYQRNTKLSQLFHIEPWNMYKYKNSSQKPWSAALKGKKVLVVHPFVESIEKQYAENREHLFEKIFDSADILPEFELKTLKAVQTLAGEEDNRFENWFDALEWMENKMDQIDYDVAIIGCGAYGYPLAAHAKEMGKVAIHLGGATQILFGIIGSRWEVENPKFCNDVVNEYWVRPMDSEKIKNGKKVENGCYW